MAQPERVQYRQALGPQGNAIQDDEMWDDGTGDDWPCDNGRWAGDISHSLMWTAASAWLAFFNKVSRSSPSGSLRAASRAASAACRSR
jgi:hypothetical protein